MPCYQKSAIIGLLLSDGWLTFASKTNKNARLGFKQCLAHTCGLCSINYHIIVVVIGIRTENLFYGLQFFTRSLACFTELHCLFYPQK